MMRLPAFIGAPFAALRGAGLRKRRRAFSPADFERFLVRTPLEETLLAGANDDQRDDLSRPRTRDGRPSPRPARR